MQQGTDEWHNDRLGKATASRASDILAKGKSGPSAMRKNYMAELVAERLTGKRAEGFTSSAIERGNELEAEARLAYEIVNGVDVMETGFVPHPTIPMTGASPDGLIGDDGLIEIKCPNTATHLETLQGGIIQKAYRDQMQWQMECTGRAWCDFISYDPRLPEPMQMHVQRVMRDDEYLSEIRQEIIKFLDDLTALENDLRARFEITKTKAL